MIRKFPLHDNWIVKLGSKRSLPGELKFPAAGLHAEVPGTVHTDLLRAKLIPDPFYGANETALQWIHELDWIYETVFDFPDEFSYDSPVELVFEGLDTIAEIFLNGKLIGRCDNMFRTWHFAVQEVLKKSGNQLRIKFISPTAFGRQQEEKYGRLPVALQSGRVYLRKAQYSFGWDWGPSFPTMGIWRPVYLRQPERLRIENVRFHTASLSEDSAAVMVQVECAGSVAEKDRLFIKLHDGKHEIHRESDLQVSTSIEQIFDIPDPELWWPNGEGEPHLYRLRVELRDENHNLLDEWEKQVGIRTIALQTVEREKPVFRFIINGKPIFMKGANWIPADSFLPRITPEKYNSLLKAAKVANMNMIRLWGGGIYENDLFYETCDELGLLVWQDFMFACAAYPEHEEFLENVREEIRQNTQRLQYHPCIALWCGNNENEWIWYQEQKRPVDEMPGFAIYHQHIPEILKRLDPLRPYWPSSPFGKDDDPGSPDSGNRHQWNLWSKWVDYAEVKEDRSLFVTEFGFQGPANRQTLEKAVPENACSPQSALFEFHNKQAEGNERLFRYLAGHLPVSAAWEDFIYLTQLNQAMALKTCLEHWRGFCPNTWGALVWQLNDCWPVTSWSLIDSELSPKISYFFVKSAFSDPFIHFLQREGDFVIELRNEAPGKFEGSLQIDLFSAGEGVALSGRRLPFCLKGGQNSGIYTFPERELRSQHDRILIVTLFDQNNQRLQRNFYPEARWKYFRMPDPEIRLEVSDEAEKQQLVLSADKLACFVDLEYEDFTFSDRGFFLLPGEGRYVEFKGRHSDQINLQDIKIFTLNRFLQKPE
ncbi:MAG: glycoside hydrolase family 2 protein [Calditrichia bacterium]